MEKGGNITMGKHWLLMIGVEMMLIAALFGVVSAFSDSDNFPLQRMTPSPAFTLSIPTPLRILPLPTVELTPTLAVTATPPLAPTRPVTATPALTPTRTVAVTPVRTPTPTRTAPPVTPLRTPPPPEIGEDEDGSDIIEFTAAPLRLRGQIQLTWRYVGEPFEGNFLVERSVNGGVWRAVSTCTAPYAPDVERYRCLETGLISGSTYAYRICTARQKTSCVDQEVVESAPVKAP
ncbi:MAG: hypothetical protein KatS3mg049_2974 [Caldilinea sp.]|jgi:hypothetical protein|nr:MAG: hypothetical protein KatS3mg049_2974 [Caldilinea sp.]